MIDVSKVKVGDELEFHRVRVTQVDASDVPIKIEWPDGASDWFMKRRFASHIPAPGHFKKGDPVTWGDGSKRATFLMSHGGTAFIAREDDSPGTAELSALRHAVASAEDEIVVTDEEIARLCEDICGSGPVLTDNGIEAAFNEMNGRYRAALVDFLKRRKEAGR
jgi:hypothetical protein